MSPRSSRSTLLLLTLVAALTAAHLAGYGQAFPTLADFLSSRDGTNARPGDAITGVASVIDGDTIEIHGQRIRFHGIDAPESRQTCFDAAGKEWRCGQKAALALADRIGKSVVSCERRDIDRYGRIVAVCFKGAGDLNAWMAAEGWAVAYLRYSREYIGDEQAARAARRGVWAGHFEMPWDWRREQRTP